jgi:hypothetical protein
MVFWFWIPTSGAVLPTTSNILPKAFVGLIPCDDALTHSSSNSEACIVLLWTLSDILMIILARISEQTFGAMTFEKNVRNAKAEIDRLITQAADGNFDGINKRKIRTLLEDMQQNKLSDRTRGCYEKLFEMGFTKFALTVSAVTRIGHHRKEFHSEMISYCEHLSTERPQLDRYLRETFGLVPCYEGLLLRSAMLPS